MGLDIIEMCMDIEEAFDINVPSEEWEKLLDVIQKSTSTKRSDLHYYADIVRDLNLD
jgi:hypothetical protein